MSVHSSSHVSGSKPTGLGHLALELLPELAQDRLVGLGGAADRHGVVSIPVSR